MIGADFEDRVPGGLSNTSINVILGISGLFGTVRPDLTDVATKETPGYVYEIKPAGSYLQGVTQLGLYLVLLNSLDPQHRSWQPGVSYRPPPILKLKEVGVIAVVSPPIEGVILYQIIDAKELFAVAAAASFAAMADIEGDVVIGFELATEGG